MSQSGSFSSGSTPPPAGGILQIDTQDGQNIGPDVNGTIFMVGVDPMFVTGNPGTNTVIIEVENASYTNIGVTRLATDEETLEGTSNNTAITPADLTVKLGTQTDHAVAIGNTQSDAIQWSNVGTNGQVLIGATGADPAFATLTSSDNTIIFTPGANTLDLKASGGSGSGITVDADTGSATPVANVLNLNGAVGGNISTTGSGNTLEVTVSGTTDHAVLVGNATGSIDSISVGSTNTVLLGNTGADPSFGQVPNAALVNNSISFTNGPSINVNPNGPVPLGSGVTIGVSGASLNAVQIGAANGGLTNVGPGTTNTVLLGNTGANPSFGQVPNAALVNSSITVNGDANISVAGSPVALGGAVNLSFPSISQYELVTANGSGAAESLPAGTGTSGQVLTSNGAGSYPTWQTFGAPIYETGVWTPAVTFSGSPTVPPSYSSQNCFYIKIGNLVYITGNLTVTSLGSGASTDVLQITGFPFATAEPTYFLIAVAQDLTSSFSNTIWTCNLNGGYATVTYFINTVSIGLFEPATRTNAPTRPVFSFSNSYYAS